jgi:hypothetical protein
MRFTSKLASRGSAGSNFECAKPRKQWASNDLPSRISLCNPLSRLVGPQYHFPFQGCSSNEVPGPSPSASFRLHATARRLDSDVTSSRNWTFITRPQWRSPDPASPVRASAPGA